MTNLERYLTTASAEKCFEYFFCHGCDVCPAREFCHTQPEGTCCRENFLEWAGVVVKTSNDPLTREELDSLNGAWVWVVAEEDPEPIHMQINTDSGTVAPSHAEYCKFENYGPGAEGYYGWVAYRRKPEEGEKNV